MFKIGKKNIGVDNYKSFTPLLSIVSIINLNSHSFCLFLKVFQEENVNCCLIDFWYQLVVAYNFPIPQPVEKSLLISVAYKI